MQYYELRFPRLTKLYRTSSRLWSEGVTLHDLHKIARESIGRDRSNKDIDDWTKEIWGTVPSPSIKCEKKRKEREAGWVDKLAMVDGAERGKIKRLKGLDSSPCPSRRQDNALTPKIDPNGAGRPVLGAKPLGPIFNLADSPHTPPSSIPVRGSPRCGIGENVDVSMGSPASPLRRQLVKPRIRSTWVYSRQASGYRDLLGVKQQGKKQKLAFGEDLMPPISISTFSKSQLPTPPQSADSVRGTATPKPLVKFVKNAFVWFAQPSNAPRPAWRLPTKNLLVGACRLHSLEALLAGCGWQTHGTTSTQMKQGVIFVDDSTSEGKSWKDYALKTLQERRATLVSDERRNRIWVFDGRLLGLDASEWKDGEIERQALWILD
jgi:DNA ligase 4